MGKIIFISLLNPPLKCGPSLRVVILGFGCGGFFFTLTCSTAIGFGISGYYYVFMELGVREGLRLAKV